MIKICAGHLKMQQILKFVNNTYKYLQKGKEKYASATCALEFR